MGDKTGSVLLGPSPLWSTAVRGLRHGSGDLHPLVVHLDDVKPVVFGPVLNMAFEVAKRSIACEPAPRCFRCAPRHERIPVVPGSSFLSTNPAMPVLSRLSVMSSVLRVGYSSFRVDSDAGHLGAVHGDQAVEPAIDPRQAHSIARSCRARCGSRNWSRSVSSSLDCGRPRWAGAATIPRASWRQWRSLCSPAPYPPKHPPLLTLRTGPLGLSMPTEFSSEVPK
jgi:hypothetical protein